MTNKRLYSRRQAITTLSAAGILFPFRKSEVESNNMDVHSVNYKMFGAVGDGQNDDGVQIKAAHAYANAHRLPVINLSGEYWIKETNDIVIQESVQWGGTVFHIDERFNARSENRFKVVSRTAPIPVELSAETKQSVLSQIKPGVSIIPELAPYKNCLLFIRDTNDLATLRTGYLSTVPRQDFFYIEEHGRIIGDVVWTFKDYTELTAFDAESGYLTIDGGTFYLSGDNPGTESAYWASGFGISRSRTIIRNQWVGLEKGRSDTSLTMRSGFYSISKAYDIQLENIRLLPWEIIRNGVRVVPEGTYGIMLGVVLNPVFRNITAEGSSDHWGVFGSNLVKNFRIERCQLNRVDVHFHCWNLTIIDSQIGYKAITFTGGGEMLIENTTVTGNNIVSFRYDYGGYWDGHIRIRHCRLKLLAPRSASILNFNLDLNHDYKHLVGFGRTIHVEDVVFDASALPQSDEPLWLMSVPQSDESSQMVYFPYDCVFKDIWVEGRSQGVRLMQLPDFSKLCTLSSTDARPTGHQPNARLVFSNISLAKPDEEKLKTGSAFHLQIASRDVQTEEILFYPDITIERCNDFVGDFGNQQMNIDFDHCSLTKIVVSKDKMKGNMRFKFCRFVPMGYDGAECAFQLEAAQFIEFLCCELNAPEKDGIAVPEWLDQLGFVKINQSLRFNHLHTRLGTNLVSMLHKQGIKLSKDFLAKLQNQFELS